MIPDPPLALTLLVARVLADDLHATMAANHLTFLTDFLDAWSNLHRASFKTEEPSVVVER
jgi:hypothetical protein